jgi:type VI secretion system secreted protein Hcp
MRKFALLLALATAALATASPASAALNAYLKIKAQKQGDIKGSVTQKGRENSIQVFGVAHEIISPRDAASGLPTGKRQHKPITVTVPVDKATPLLFQALVSNEMLQNVTIDFWRGGGAGLSRAGAGATGVEQLYYKIELANAAVASIVLDSTSPGDDRLKVSFVYQKITETFVDGGITTEDDWSAPQN